MKTAKWLAGELGKDPATVSKWCTNVSQPSLDTLVEVSKALDVDVRELLVSTKEEPKYIRVEWWQTKDKQKNERIIIIQSCDEVVFTLNEIQKEGVVFIFDANGTFERPRIPSYDILVENENMLYKHVP